MPGQISDRADRLIAFLRTLDGKIALFSHGQFGCVLAARCPPALCRWHPCPSRWRRSEAKSFWAV
jgi:ABC-type antimicrobial peptide transport system ATPase subunit